MLNLEKVSFRYRQGFRLQECTLALNPGELTVLLGPNGSGKSTLLRLASGWLVPDSGKVTLDDCAMTHISGRKRARTIGVVHQQSAPALGITAEEMVMLGREAHLPALGGPGVADRAAVSAALDALELGPLRRRAVAELSGGEQQRVRIAAALAGEPEYLLLDEPTSAQDPRRRRLILQVLQTRLPYCGILIATHDLELAAAARTLGLMQDGRLLALGAPEQVLTVPLLESVYHCPVEIAHWPDGTPCIRFPDHPAE